MARQISSALTGPLVLRPSDNPLTITGTGSVASTGTLVDGIDGAAGTAWSITNQGRVSSAGGWGIRLAGAGTLANSGAISGLSGGFGTGGRGLVTNRGTISCGAGTIIAVSLGAGGSVTNNAAGSISSGRLGVGVEIGGASGSVTNTGTILGGRIGVSLDAGGSVTNNAAGSLLASSEGVGVEIGGASGTITNNGSISAGAGIVLGAGGSVTNNAGGFIEAGFRGVAVGIGGGAGAVTNKGTINGGRFGVSLDAGGSVTNNAGASISGLVNGIATGGGSTTVTNAGTISGGTHSVLFGSGSTNNRLVIKPGAVFSGSADATAATNSTIELANGTGATSGIGNGQFLGFNTLVADAQANWKLNGSNTIGTVLNNGKLEVAGGLTVSTAVAPNSTGIFKLDGGSTLEVAAALGINSRMSFTPGSELVVDHFGLFGRNVGTSNYAGSLLQDFGGSTIDLKDFGIAGLRGSFSTSTGLLQLTNAAAQRATLDFQTSTLGTGTFHYISDGSSGVLITHS